MRILRILVVLLSLAGCVGQTGVSSPTVASGPTATPDALPGAMRTSAGMNLLVVAGEGVQIKREGWNQYQRALFGIPLYHGDLLQPETGAQAVVLCSDLRSWLVPDGAPSGLANGCPVTEEDVVFLERAGGNIAPTRAGPADSIPYVISPRMTRLLDGSFLLRWNTLPGVDMYTVTVMGGSTFEWTQQANDSGLLYDGEDLQRGQSYRIIIKGGGVSSEEEGGQGLGFQLLSEEDAAAVRADQARIAVQQLPETAEELAYAELYAQHRLWAEAIAMVEGLVAQHDDAWTLTLRLGELYGQIALPVEAQAAYDQALLQAEAAGDLEGQARAALGLAALSDDVTEKEERLNEALVAYEKLGDINQADVVREQLSAIAP